MLLFNGPCYRDWLTYQTLQSCQFICNIFHERCEVLLTCQKKDNIYCLYYNKTVCCIQTDTGVAPTTAAGSTGASCGTSPEVLHTGTVTLNQDQCGSAVGVQQFKLKFTLGSKTLESAAFPFTCVGKLILLIYVILPAPIPMFYDFLNKPHCKF